MMVEIRDKEGKFLALLEIALMDGGSAGMNVAMTENSESK